MTNILISGDYAPDGTGGIRRADGMQGMLAEALFRLTCRRGSFPLLPELGSRLHTLAREKPAARNMAARQYAAEALSGMELEVTDAAVIELDENAARVRIALRGKDDQIALEVTT
ncbi:MAG: hypothetical protein IJS31_03240 [Oscillospiraceae bacterium]|nr:hypothetical protein [Oscillospiraceae bacterium]